MLINKKQFPFYKQLDSTDCGPSCLRMIAKYYGKSYSLETLRERCFISREGVSFLGISNAAESIGFHTMAARVSFSQLKNEVPLPCIVHWKENHFIVVYKIKNNKIFVADPGYGHIKYTEEEFKSGWIYKDSEEKTGSVLILEPTPDFFTTTDEPLNKSSFKYLFTYFTKYKRLVVQLLIGMLVGSLLQLIFPFLTQAIVDIGINNQNIGFIYLILIAQLVLYIGRTTVEFIRSWILLHISTRINISLISDFLSKLMRLPIGFFDSKMIGDLIQRIGDHRRIESFLTTSTLNIIFSIVNIIIFSIVLLIYSLKIFIVFVIASIFYFSWVLLFLKKRRTLDYKRFAQLALNQSTIIQLITGIQEIKLNNVEKQKRWDWEKIQAKLFKVNIKSLALSQYQNAGGTFINETKNIIISFFAATSVISGDITLGMMLAIQYIIGQLNGPIAQLIGFLHTAQDAKISLERLGEIHKNADEEPLDRRIISHIPASSDIILSNVSFKYVDIDEEYAIKNIDLTIPARKTTAIVGISGSGKTTLIKLILGFYPSTEGEIKIGSINLENISLRSWRDMCGAVMQDGFVFNDTIANNIAMDEENMQYDKLMKSVEIANIKGFVERLPLKYNTKIGMDGHGLSQGQLQRILIARVIYKDPDYLFLDEATNSLDAKNEYAIQKQLADVVTGKTVIIVAHRLNTVKNADMIVVLDRGEIIETGDHKSLVLKKGAYYNLIKNQLELGK